MNIDMKLLYTSLYENSFAVCSAGNVLLVRLGSHKYNITYSQQVGQNGHLIAKYYVFDCNTGVTRVFYTRSDVLACMRSLRTLKRFGKE